MKMTESTLLAEARAILAEGPSEQAFIGVRSLIDSLEARELLNQLNVAISQGIQSWTHASRIARTTWEGLPQLMQLPSWPFIETLDFFPHSQPQTLHHQLHAFVHSPEARHLRRINFGHDLTTENLLSLITSANLPNLEAIALSARQLPFEAFQDLGKSELAGRLKELSLSFPPPVFGDGADAYRVLFESQCLSQLDTLSVYFPPAGLLDRLNSFRLPALKSVRIQCFDGASSINELLRAETLLSGLQSLQLPSSQIGDDGIQQLLRSAPLESLVSLDLTDNNLGSRSASIVADWKHVSSLQKLFLGLNPIGAEGWAALGRLRNTCLQTLCLDRTGGGDFGLKRLVEGGLTSTLEDLDLQGNAIGAEGVALLASDANSNRMRVLTLDNNPLGDQGSKAIGAGDSLGEIRTLSLRHTQMGEDGFEYLTAMNNRVLQHLLLDGGDFGGASIERIADSPFAESLHEISFNGCRLGDVGMLRLCRARELNGLRVLRVGANHIGDRGIAEMKTSNFAPHLWVVDLSHNPIGDVAFREVVASGVLREVNELRIEGTNVTTKSVNTALVNLQRLKLLVHHDLPCWTS